ncbi:hypothetical protein Emed_005096 [Eimeria media]
MLPASVPVPDASDAALELAALDLLSRHSETPELPSHAPPGEASSNVKEKRGGPGARLTRALSRPFRSPAHYFQRLHREFGGSLLLCLASNYLFLKGAAYHMAIAASTPVFREVLKLQAEQHSVATALFMIPWSIKGIVGSFSDLFALGGYHKRSYMVLASLLGIVGSSLLIGFAGSLTMGIAVAGFFLIMMQASCNDLLCEGTYTRRMAEKPYTGAALTSFVWLCSSFGTFLQAVWVGPVVDHLPFHVVLLPFLPLCLQQFFLLLWPWPFKSWSSHAGIVGETHVQPGERFRKTLISDHGLANDSRHVVGVVYWACAGLCMSVTVACTLPAFLAKPVLYLFLSRMLVPTITSQFSYWLRAGPDCVVEGPHFSWTFLLTWNALAQAFFAFVGVALFQRYVSKWSFRRAFLVTSFLQQATCLFDVVMVMRWNIAMGIPDRVWYFFSASIIEEVASMWAFMPGCVLVSRLCPKNIESTMYAVVAGLQNFAQSMSKFAGNFLCFTLLGMRTLPSAEGGCNFQKLPLAIGISSGVCPFFPILLTLWLIPNLLMDQPFEPPASHKPRDADAAEAAEAAAEAAAAADAAAAAAAAAGDGKESPALGGSGFDNQKSASSSSALGVASTKESPESSDREGLPSGSSAEFEGPLTALATAADTAAAAAAASTAAAATAAAAAAAAATAAAEGRLENLILCFVRVCEKASRCKCLLRHFQQRHSLYFYSGSSTMHPGSSSSCCCCCLDAALCIKAATAAAAAAAATAAAIAAAAAAAAGAAAAAATAAAAGAATAAAAASAAGDAAANAAAWRQRECQLSGHQVSF